MSQSERQLEDLRRRGIPLHLARFVEMQQSSNPVPIVQNYNFEKNIGKIALQYANPYLRLFYKIHVLPPTYTAIFGKTFAFNSDFTINDPKVIIDNFFKEDVYYGPIKCDDRVFNTPRSPGFFVFQDILLRIFEHWSTCYLRYTYGMYDPNWQIALKDLYDLLINCLLQYPDIFVSDYLEKLMYKHNRRIEHDIQNPEDEIMREDIGIDPINYIVYDIQTMLDFFLEALYKRMKTGRTIF